MRPASAFLLLLSLGCGEAADVTPDAGSPVEPVPPPAPAIPAAETPAPEDSETPEPVDDGSPMVTIPAGPVLLGSRSGSAGRDATAEADLVAVSLPAFAIDRRPYPNDPDRPPMTNVDRRQATSLCEAEGKRLCTELEWERACKGDGDRQFPAGASFEPEAMSPFGLHAMGATHGEWTASPDVRRLAPGTAHAAVFRGGSADQEPAFHRCAARRATAATTQSRHLTFRCCQGPEPDASYPAEPFTPRVQRLDRSVETLREHLRAVPELAAFADAFSPASDESMMRAVGDPAILNGWELAGPALRWTPVDGEEIWVYSGSVDGRAAVVAIFHQADGRLLHGATLLFGADEGPVAVAFTPPERRFLQVSVDYGRTAAGAVLFYDEDGTLSFEPR